MFANNISAGKSVFHPNTESNRLLIQRLENHISNALLTTILDYETRASDLMKKHRPLSSICTPHAKSRESSSDFIGEDTTRDIKPEIQRYIDLYGIPEDGVFDKNRMGELQANKI